MENSSPTVVKDDKHIQNLKCHCRDCKEVHASLMFPLAMAIDAPWSVSPTPAAAAVIGIAFISTAAAYLLFFRILAAAGATNVLLVTFLIPISALLLGVGVLGQAVKVLEYAGMGCILLGLIVIDGRVAQWAKNWLNLKQKSVYNSNG